MTTTRTPALFPRLLLLTCVVAAVATAAGAQEITSSKKANSALKKEFRQQRKHQKSVLKQAFKELKLGLKEIQTEAEDGALDTLEVAERAHAEFTSCLALTKTVTAFAASEVSFAAGDVLSELQSNTSEGMPVTFTPGAQTTLDKGVAKLRRTGDKTMRRIARRARGFTKKLRKRGYDVTVRVVDTLPIAIAPNPDAAFTALNFDTVIDVLVGVGRDDVAGDTALVIGGISNPAKVSEVDVQINGVGGIEHSQVTPIENDRWTVVFDGDDLALPASNYRVIATHGSTRVGTTIGLR